MRFRTSFAVAALASSALALSACTVGPDFTPPKAEVPSTWSGNPPKLPPTASTVTTEAAPTDAWWTTFNDPQLNALIERAGTSNLDLRQAALRIEEARQQVGVAGARDLPTIALDSSYTRSLISPNGALSLFGAAPSNTSGTGPVASTAGAFPNFAGGIPPFGMFQTGFDASWEPDFFGKTRRSVEAAEAQTTAALEDRNDMLLSVYAEIARSYVQLRGLQQLIAITQNNLGAQRQAFDLTRRQAQGGETSNLDVEASSAEVATTEAQLPTLQDQQARTVNALSHLLGREPGALQAELEAPKAIPGLPPRVPIGLPADLVRRRPDVRRAEATLHAATAQIGVITADLYPRLNLSGSLGLQAIRFNKLSDWASHFYNFGPSLAIPIFNGTTYATIELQETRQKEAALAWENTVLTALHEVENAVSSYGAEQVRLRSLQLSATANRHSLDLAQQRYRAGLSNFLDVLDSERRVFASETAVENSQIAISTNLIAIYKALGGGWENGPAPAPVAVSAK